MKITKIKDPIAERMLTCGGDEVVVTIGRPEKTPGEADFFCPYSIKFRGKTKFWYATGVDTCQALLLALQVMESELIFLSKKAGKPVSWFPDKPGETGFTFKSFS